MHVLYCEFSQSGYHEGVISEYDSVFFDQSVFPKTKKYIAGCPPGFNLYVCRACGEQIYYDPLFDKYIDPSDVHYVKDGVVYYACVYPADVHNGHLGWVFSNSN